MILRNKNKNKKFLPPEILLKYLKQAALAVEYCHSLDIVHVNITAQSLYVSSEGVVKIGDFHFARNIAGLSEYVIGK